MALTIDVQLVYNHGFELLLLICFQNLMHCVSCHIYQTCCGENWVTQICMYCWDIHDYINHRARWYCPTADLDQPGGCFVCPDRVLVKKPGEYKGLRPGARFLKLPVITGPVKLFCFPFQMGVSKGLKIVQ